MLDIQKAKEKFDDFLFEMEDRVEAIEAEAEKHNIDLTRTMESLEKLELLFFKLAENSTEDERESLIISFARYVGEILRNDFHARWHLSLDDPKNVYYNTPVIVDHVPIKGLEFSPIFAVRALSLRKKHGILRQNIMTHIQPPDFGLSDSFEEE